MWKIKNFNTLMGHKILFLLKGKHIYRRLQHFIDKRILNGNDLRPLKVLKLMPKESQKHLDQFLSTMSENVDQCFHLFETNLKSIVMSD